MALQSRARGENVRCTRLSALNWTPAKLQLALRHPLKDVNKRVGSNEVSLVRNHPSNRRARLRHDLFIEHACLSLKQYVDEFLRCLTV